MNKAAKMTAVFLVLLVPLAACAGFFGGIGPHTHQSSASGGSTLAPNNVTISGALDGTRACTAPDPEVYVRMNPNYCAHSGSFAHVALVRDVCTAIASPSVNAKVLVMQFRTESHAANAVGIRSVDIKSDNESTCTGPINTVAQVAAYEFSPLASGEKLASESAMVNLNVTGGFVYVVLSDDATNNGTGSYRIVGYVD